MISNRPVTVPTDDEGDHGGSISPCGFQALDELFHLPDLNVLLGLVGLGVTHFGGRWRFEISVLEGSSRQMLDAVGHSVKIDLFSVVGGG